MNTSEAFKLGAEKLVSELSWDSIEFLFKPTNMGELLLRLDFKGFKAMVYEAFVNDAPDAMPWRFRGAYWPAWKWAIDKEAFYRECQKIKPTGEEL